MTRSNQGGSVASFIIVAALLVLGTAGLLYWVKQGDTPRVVSPEVAISDNATDKKKPNSGTEAQKPDEGQTSNQTDTSNRSSTESRDRQTGSQSSGSNRSGQIESTVTELSQTGPADTLMQIFMVGILAVAIAAYLQSVKTAALQRSSL